MTVSASNFADYFGSSSALGVIRPVPPQLGHSNRTNATLFGSPWGSTRSVTNPNPPQLGHSSASTNFASPILLEITLQR